MELQLIEKVVCVTGGSRGIGLATATAFAQEGAKVIICARGQERLAEAVEHVKRATGVTIDAVQADVTRLADIDRLVAHLDQNYGRLDILVNNAGTGIYKPFAEVTEEDLMQGMSVNFFAQFRLTQRALGLLKKAGNSVVINVSGRTALRGNFPPGSSCTGPAKAAEVRFSIDLATELAEHGVRVNCVIPGVVKSEDRFKLWESQAISPNLDSQTTENVRQHLEAASVPQGQRWGMPEEIADVIVFLSSPRAAYVNGAALTVDGGPHNKSYVTQLYANKPGLQQSAQ
ncbi:MAG TPA: SDR family oxidoreductase [Burkholderiaceae bacterium]|nr:SDR family oxidoreductase [Burkholderiaceae bacterium]